jgi:hypothetical protein
MHGGKMSKSGIPRLPADIKKSRHVTVRFTADEYKILSATAESADTTVSKLIRGAVTKIRAWTPENQKIEKEKINQLAKIGNNLNQIARMVNTQGVVNYEIEILERLSAIENEIIQIFYSEDR